MDVALHTKDDMDTTNVIDDYEPRSRGKDLQPLAYSLDEAVRISDSCRSIIYREMKAGRLKFLKVGSRTLILREDLLAWLQSHRAEKLRKGPEGTFGHPKKAA